MRFVALLRGINVGGNNMIKMTELKAAFERLGFENVVTYINSGNVAFDRKSPRVSSPHVSKGSLESESTLVSEIEHAIKTDFGKQVPVMVREQEHIERVIAGNPFAGEFESHKEMHVLFMREEMPADKRDLLLAQQTPDERFAVIGREIYAHLRIGVADSLLGRGFIEKKLKIAITGRNWRTVQKLAEL